MLYFRGSRFLRRVVLPLTLLAFLSACHKWVPLEPPVARAIAETESGTIRITLADSSRMVLDLPRVDDDSLYAIDVKAAGHVTVPLRDVVLVEEKQAEGGKTALLIGGIVLGAALLAFVVAGISYDLATGTN
jgi:hypothetical protein